MQRQNNDTRYKNRKAKLEADIERCNEEIDAFFVAVSELQALEEQHKEICFAAVEHYADLGTKDQRGLIETPM